MAQDGLHSSSKQPNSISYLLASFFNDILLRVTALNSKNFYLLGNVILVSGIKHSYLVII